MRAPPPDEELDELLEVPVPLDELLDVPVPLDELLDDVARVGHIDWVPGELSALAHFIVPVSQRSPPSQSVSFVHAVSGEGT